MKKLLSVVLAVVMLATFVVSASAADENLLTKGSAGPNTDKATVTTGADGSIEVVVTAGVDAQNNGHGLALEPAMTGVNVKKDGGTGFIHLVMESDTPFRVTMLDRTAGKDDKWISFGGEFFNVFVPEGTTFANPDAPTIQEALEDGKEFMKAGKYDVYLYLGGVYEWKANNGEADKYDPTNASITALYFEAKNPGKFTIKEMTLTSNDGSGEGDGDQGGDTTTTTAPTASGDSNTATTTAAQTTTTVKKPAGNTTDSAKTGDVSNAIVFVVVAAAAAGVVTMSAVSKKSKAR